MDGEPFSAELIIDPTGLSFEATRLARSHVGFRSTKGRVNYKYWKQEHLAPQYATSVCNRTIACGYEL